MDDAALPTLEIAVVGVWRRVATHAGEGSARNPELLIARRGPGAVLGGLWELPGGKVESGETVVEAALREAREETGIVLDTAEEVGVVEGGGDFEGGRRTSRVRLHALIAEVGAETLARPLCSAECRWVPIAQIDRFEWPKANRTLNRLVCEAIRARFDSTADTPA